MGAINRESAIVLSIQQRQQETLRQQRAASQSTAFYDVSSGGFETGYTNTSRRPPNSGVLSATTNSTNVTPYTAFQPSSKVKLVEERTSEETQQTAEGRFYDRNCVVFDVQPELSENASASWISIDDIRAPGSLLIFMGSPAREFGLSARLVSRTTDEAYQNFRYLHLLKSWRTLQQNSNYRNRLGDTNVPRTLRLYAYGKNLKGIPVVVTSLNYTFPSDCDYISVDASNNTTLTPQINDVASMPIILDLTINLKETRIPDELTKEFSLDKYKVGDLRYW